MTLRFVVDMRGGGGNAGRMLWVMISIALVLRSCGVFIFALFLYSINARNYLIHGPRRVTVSSFAALIYMSIVLLPTKKDTNL